VLLLISLITQRVADSSSTVSGSLSVLADWASLLGLLGTVIGFVVTVIQVRKSRSAADLAALAAKEAKDALVRSNILTDFAAAVSAFAEVQRLHRAGAWQAVLDRYSSTRHQLIAVRTSMSITEEAQLQAIQSAIQQLSEMERSVTRDLANSREPDAAKLNTILSREADELMMVLTSLRLTNEN
jgi:hypothetical protein